MTSVKTLRWNARCADVGDGTGGESKLAQNAHGSHNLNRRELKEVAWDTSLLYLFFQVGLRLEMTPADHLADCQTLVEKHSLPFFKETNVNWPEISITYYSSTTTITL